MSDNLTSNPVATRAVIVEYATSAADDAVKRLNETWPNDSLVRRLERSVRFLLRELPSDEPGTADLIREAFATMQSHAERHARKADKAKEDYWSSAHAAYAKQSEDWCARAQSFLDGAAPPPGECQHAETIDLEDAHARWCTECGAFHDGTQWIHSRRVAVPPSPGEGRAMRERERAQ